MEANPEIDIIVHTQNYNNISISAYLLEEDRIEYLDTLIMRVV